MAKWSQSRVWNNGHGSESHTFVSLLFPFVSPLFFVARLIVTSVSEEDLSQANLLALRYQIETVVTIGAGDFLSNH